MTNRNSLIYQEIIGQLNLKKGNDAQAVYCVAPDIRRPVVNKRLQNGVPEACDLAGQSTSAKEKIKA